ncbi:MAG: hypothetical protein AB7S26_28560 [Sandaracinaceae bacterium]
MNKQLLLLMVTPMLLAMPSMASAQRDDVQWESRTIPYDGGPVRPGAELDGSLNPLSWIGGIGFLAGYGVLIYPATARPEALIPLAGPWMALSDQVTWNGFSTVDRILCVLGGVLQPAGIVMSIIGLLSPNLRLVFTAPVGGPSAYDSASISFEPSAPSADAGASIVVRW